MSGAQIRLLHVCGARPNFMKVAPVMAAVEAWNEASAGAAGPGGALGLPARSVRFQQLDDDACPWEEVCAAWPRARTLASPWATAATRRPGRTWRYPGLKEHIALAGFTPDPGYLGRAGIDASRPVVVVRPPADLEAAGFGARLWRGEALDGRRLVAGADAVVSAGGSMNREAAVLGTPARRRGPRPCGRRLPASAPRCP